jgi:deazaflavin-dependent oxidoreductase (nitroreductase family)
MTYLKPPAFTRRVFNPIAMRFGLGGSSTLTIPGRRTGQPQTVPVIPVTHDGARYIVSTRGESEWVRNLRAAGVAELNHKGDHQRYRATEVPVAESGPIIDAYRNAAGRTVQGYWQTLPDPADHPTFRLDPI